MKTRAVVSVEQGKPLVIEELELPDPGPTHVIVKQFATGICHSQIHQIHRADSVRPCSSAGSRKAGCLSMPS